MIIRLDEHGTKPEKTIYKYLSSCGKFNSFIKLFELPNIKRINSIISKELHLHSTVVYYLEIINYNNK